MRGAWIILGALALAWGGCDETVRLPVNYPCAQGDQCLEGVCHANTCVLPTPRPTGADCVDRGECKSFRCAKGLCSVGTRSGGSACRFNDECANRKCVAGFCGGGDGGVDGGSDGGPDGSGPDLAKVDRGRTDGPSPDGPVLDGPIPVDVGALDKSISKEAGIIPDKAIPLDKAVPADKAVPLDKAPKPDQATPADKGVLPDQMLMPDQSLPPDQKVAPDTKPATCTGKLSLVTHSGSKVVAAGGIQDIPAVAGGGGCYLAVWRDLQKGQADLYGVLMDDASVKFGPFPISYGAKAEDEPAVAYGDGKFIVAWTDSRNFATTGRDIYAATVTATGCSSATVTNTAAITNAKYDQDQPAVASDGKNFMLVWRDFHLGFGTQPRLLAKRRGSGIVQTVASSSGIKRPAMAYGPGLYLAVWMDGRNSTNQDIFGRRLDSQGKLQGLELQMAATTTTKLNPAVVGSGAGYLVAWTDGGKSIKGALAGKTTGPTATPTLRSTTGLLTHPALAFDGCKYSLAWSEKVSLITLGYDVMALPVTTAGVPATGQLSKITHSGDQAEAVMASRGSERSLVLFSDSRTSGNDTDIYAGTYKP